MDLLIDEQRYLEILRVGRQAQQEFIKDSQELDLAIQTEEKTLHEWIKNKDNDTDRERETKREGSRPSSLSLEEISGIVNSN